MPTEWVQQVIEEEIIIEKIFNRIVDVADVSRSAARIKLMNVLPPGFVCVETSQITGEIIRIDESRNGCLSLFIEPGDRSSLQRLTKALEFHAVDGWILRNGTTRAHWWRLDSHCEIPRDGRRSLISGHLEGDC